jgi:hypothetical protein
VHACDLLGVADGAAAFHAVHAVHAVTCCDMSCGADGEMLCSEEVHVTFNDVVLQTLIPNYPAHFKVFLAICAKLPSSLVSI